MIIDDDGPWCAACYAVEDTEAAGTCHGFDHGASLCGLPESGGGGGGVPFRGRSPRDCPACAEVLLRRAAAAGWSPLSG